MKNIRSACRYTPAARDTRKSNCGSSSRGVLAAGLGSNDGGRAARSGVPNALDADAVRAVPNLCGAGPNDYPGA